MQIDIDRMNKTLREWFAEGCERFPDMDKAKLWDACKAGVMITEIVTRARKAGYNLSREAMEKIFADCTERYCNQKTHG